MAGSGTGRTPSRIDSQTLQHQTQAAENRTELQLPIRASARQGGRWKAKGPQPASPLLLPPSRQRFLPMRSRPLLNWEETKSREHMKEGIRSDWMPNVHSAIKKPVVRTGSVVKPQDTAELEAGSGSTGGLVHGKLSIRGDGRKGTPKSQRNQG